MAKKQLQKVIGLMSGTSGDGADVALIATDGEDAIEFFGGLTLPYDRELRVRVLEAAHYDVPLLELARVERDITLHHAEAVAELRRTLPQRERRHRLDRVSRPHDSAYRQRANLLADQQSLAACGKDRACAW